MKSILLKKTRPFLLLLLCVYQFAHAQAPQKMSYQAVIRNLSNQLVVSAPIGMRINILQGSATGTSVYKETHFTTTNANGLISIEIGTGTLVSGSFNTIDWSAGPYYIETETDPSGGSSYTIIGTSQLLSVPYALFAEKVKPIVCLTNANCPPGFTCAGGSCVPTLPGGTSVGDMQYWNGTAWVMIPIGTPGQFLQVNSSNIPAWSGGDFPTLITNTISNQVSAFDPSQHVFGNLTSTGITPSGGSPIIGYGFCWNTVPNPTTANYSCYSQLSLNVGNFDSYLTNLLPSTTYYVRAYVINSTGTTYGNQVSFSTFTPSIPTVTTTVISGITGGVANSGGNVTSDGGAVVSVRGVCWSTSPMPTTLNSKTNSGSSTGTFSSILNGLINNTTYYVRAYASNVAGTAYGTQYSFTTAANLSIGSYYQGGLIAYYLQSGDPGYNAFVQHGIIISQNDVATAVPWGCFGTLVAGANGSIIGSGAQNTLDIVGGCATPGIAAEICDNLVLNSYSDWFLPSDADWIAIDLNLVLINGISNQQGYWTSNQQSANAAHVTFNNYPAYTGYIANIQKFDINSYGGVVRAIRMF